MIIRGETFAERYKRMKAEREAKAARNRKKNKELIERFYKDPNVGRFYVEPNAGRESAKLPKGYEIR